MLIARARSYEPRIRLAVLEPAGSRPRSPGCWPIDMASPEDFATCSIGNSRFPVARSSVLGVLMVSSHDAIAQISLGGKMESREDCLREATECDRLAELANTHATRALLVLAAFQWRKLAEKAKAPLTLVARNHISELDAQAEGRAHHSDDISNWPQGVVILQQ